LDNTTQTWRLYEPNNLVLEPRRHKISGRW
jgi:hypothetical protein